MNKQNAQYLLDFILDRKAGYEKEGLIPTLDLLAEDLKKIVDTEEIDTPIVYPEEKDPFEAIEDCGDCKGESCTSSLHKQI